MKTIELQNTGPVAWVWLNQPQRLNAINETTLAELRLVFEELDRNEEVRAIVLAGRGPAFSAGFDVAYMAGLTPEAVADGLDGTRAVFDVIEKCSKPLIAAIHGAVMGGGLLLALVSDLRLANERASFGAPEVKIGIFPSLDLIPRLERVVGVGLAKKIVLTGEPIDATEAHRIGLVERIIPAESLHAEAQKLAEQLARLPPLAVQLAKEAFAAARGPGYADWEKKQFVACWASPQRPAAMRKFLGAG
ncbi:MAG: enoyl-CoA hydratase/isomerase family protein [Verrucomicrobia bacterium]|nr:enoyl-CoA hydratase/isomerase family protein [Verrucomicrobiota bacterium]